MLTDECDKKIDFGKRSGLRCSVAMTAEFFSLYCYFYIVVSMSIICNVSGMNLSGIAWQFATQDRRTATQNSPRLAENCDAYRLFMPSLRCQETCTECSAVIQAL